MGADDRLVKNSYDAAAVPRSAAAALWRWVQRYRPLIEMGAVGSKLRYLRCCDLSIEEVSFFAATRAEQTQSHSATNIFRL